MNYERHYGVEARVEYPDMSVRLVVGDSIEHFDPARSERACLNEACVAYHVYCDQDANPEYCLVVLERGREGAISIQATAVAERLPTDWRDRLSVLPAGSAEPISFAQMRTSEGREWPHEPWRRPP
jgi:hypothetical protein